MTEGGSTQGLGPGSRVAGYLIEEQIGAGGMAIVFRARDEMLGRAVALKVMSPRYAEDAEFRARFIRESRTIAAVDDPHIIPVYAAGDAGGVLYIATRYIPSGDLAKLLDSTGGYLPPDRTASLIAQVASALDAAHAAGLVHRDVKLANILVEALPGRPEHAYLSDFGLTKGTSATSTGLTAVGQFMGTPDYCAPEQITGATVDGRADQYALACAAFAMLTGAPPFSKADPVASLFAHLNDPIPAPSAHRAGIPPAVDAVIARGMAKAPEARYATCAEFAAALREAVSGPGGAPAAPAAPVYQPTEQVSAYSLSAPAYAPPTPSFTPPAPSYTPAAPAYIPAPAAAYPQPVSYPPPAPAPAPVSYVAPGGYAPAGGSAPAPAGGSVPFGASAPPGGSFPHGGYGPQGGYAPPAGPVPPGGYHSPPFGTTTPLGGTPGLTSPPQYAAGAGSRPRRRTGLIAGGITVAVLAAAGAGTGLALSGSQQTPPGPNNNGGQHGLAYTSAALGGSLSAPGNNVGEAAFSPDGTILVTDEFNNKSTVDSFYVWDTASHKRLSALAIPGDYVSASNPVISADNKTVTEMAIRSYPDSKSVQVYRWDVATGTRTTIFAVNSPEKTWGAVYGTTTLSGDGGKLLVEAPGGGAVDVWDVNGDQKIATLTLPSSAKIIGDDISSDGRVAGVSDASGRTYIWDVASQQVKTSFSFAYKPPASGNAPTFPGLSPDGKQALIYGNGAPMTLRDIATGADVTPHDSRWATQTGWMYSPDGKVLATQGKTPTTLELWNAATRAHLLTITFPASAHQWGYAMSPDNKQMLTVGVTASDSDTGTTYLWNLVQAG